MLCLIYDSSFSINPTIYFVDSTTISGSCPCSLSCLVVLFMNEVLILFDFYDFIFSPFCPSIWVDLNQEGVKLPHKISNVFEKPLCLIKMKFNLCNYGPLHVLWQVSFVCWVPWSISSWQEYYKSVFFFNFTKLQFLNDKIYSYTKKKLFGTWQFDFIIQKFARLKSKHFSQFFWWEVNLRGLRAFMLQKVQASVVKRLIILLSAWDRSRDSTAKRNLSKDI